MKTPELLAPAGTLTKLKFAVEYGADAVYIGGQDFGLRSRAGNFSLQEIRYARQYTVERDRRLYVTVNAFGQPGEETALREYLEQLSNIEPDALIISDPGIMTLARRQTHLPLYVSTQASVANGRALNFWKQLGATRVILARELSLNEIRNLAVHSPVELETFVHGALCSSWSGKCTMSNYLSGRDANRGGCTHTCRWLWSTDDGVSGRFLYSQDLQALELLPQLVATGVHSLKIEGRMKSILYIARVTRIYRDALDRLAQHPAGTSLDFSDLAARLDQINRRPVGPGTLFGHRGPSTLDRDGNRQPVVRFIGHQIAQRNDERWFQISSPVTDGTRLRLITPAAECLLEPDQLRLPHGTVARNLSPNSVVRVAGTSEYPGLAYLESEQRAG